MPTQHWDQAWAGTEQPRTSFVDEHGCIDHWGCQPSSRARSFVCPCTCIKMYAQKEEALAWRRAARSMVTRSLLFIINTSYQKLPFGSGDLSSGDDVHPRLVLLILIGIYEYRTITHLIRIRALLLHRPSGTRAKFVSHEDFFFLASAPDGGVRVGT